MGFPRLGPVQAGDGVGVRVGTEHAQFALAGQDVGEWGRRGWLLVRTPSWGAYCVGVVGRHPAGHAAETRGNQHAGRATPDFQVGRDQPVRRRRRGSEPLQDREERVGVDEPRRVLITAEDDLVLPRLEPVRRKEERESGRGLDDVLGLEAQVTGTWAPETPVRSSSPSSGSCSPVSRSPRRSSAAVRMRLISLDGAPVTVKSPKLLQIGLELARSGIPVTEAMDELEALQAAADAIAERFTRVF
jgi:hypothetical protein